MTAETPHILVIDDDERIRTLLAKYLSRNGYLVTGARDASHARRLLESLAFDLMVVDVMMPGEDGLSFTRSVRETGETPVLLLTARGETDDRIAGLEAGADDYLAKPFEPRELLLRIAAVLRRAPEPEEPPKPDMFHLGACRYDVERGELWRGEELVRLTTSEAVMMRLFARKVNEPVSRLDLLSELGGDGEESQSQERAIDVQITRLRRKFEANPKAPRYLQTVRGAGYMFTPDRH